MEKINYLIIGNGKAARHFKHYLDLLSISYHTWTRQEDVSVLHRYLETPCVVLCLIKDDAIQTFIERLKGKEESLRENCAAGFSQKHTFVHFSGCLTLDGALGTHPLISFGNSLLTLEEYQKIPFILDQNASSWTTVFPKLSNAHYEIPREKKAFYHSLCVLSGNFSQLLWQKLFHELEGLNIPKETAFPYLRQITRNLEEGSPLTGPLARGDEGTIQRNLEALSNDPYQGVYQSFVEAYKQRQ